MSATLVCRHNGRVKYRSFNSEVRQEKHKSLFNNLFGNEADIMHSIDQGDLHSGILIVNGYVDVKDGVMKPTKKSDKLQTLTKAANISVELTSLRPSFDYWNATLDAEFMLTNSKGEKAYSYICIGADSINIDTWTFRTHLILNSKDYLDAIVNALCRRKRTWQGRSCKRIVGNNRFDCPALNYIINKAATFYKKKGDTTYSYDDLITQTAIKSDTTMAMHYTEYSGNKIDESVLIQDFEKDNFRMNYDVEGAYSLFLQLQTNTSLDDNSMKSLVNKARIGYLNFTNGVCTFMAPSLIPIMQERNQAILNWYKETKGRWKLYSFDLDNVELTFQSDDERQIPIHINSGQDSAYFNKVLANNNLIDDLFKEFSKYMTPAMVADLAEKALEGEDNNKGPLSLRAFLNVISQNNLIGGNNNG